MGNTERELALGAIGTRLRQRRNELEFTQEVLSELADVSKSFVSELEGGQRAASGLVYLRLAEALDVPVQWLLTGEELSAVAREASEVIIPPILSNIAEESGWTHQETMDVAAALRGVVARRTGSGRKWEMTRENILAIAKAIRGEQED